MCICILPAWGTCCLFEERHARFHLMVVPLPEQLYFTRDGAPIVKWDFHLTMVPVPEQLYFTRERGPIVKWDAEIRRI